MAEKLNREKVFNKTNGHCAYCGCELDFFNFEIDHIIPKKRGGNNRIENLYPCCRDCNIFKYDNEIEEFRRKVSNIILDTFHGRIASKFYKIQPKEIVFYYEENNNG